MSITNIQLLTYLDTLLKPEKVRDYCPNGLQVEGKQQIEKLITGVTASERLIDAAIERQADAIFVHHGYFWKGESLCLRGMKRNRLKKLLENDINLFAYHLPLDNHPQLGNNAQLAKLLGIEVTTALEPNNPQSVGMQGELPTTLNIQQFSKLIEQRLHRTPLVEAQGPAEIKRVGWCTGGGQSFIEHAVQQNLDCFISGEVSEQTIHIAREAGIHFIAAGHHATERYGAKAVGDYLNEQLDLQVEFVDIDNPA